MQATKRCTKCGVTKAMGEFNRWTFARDGRSPCCRLCNREYVRGRMANPEIRRRENDRQRKRKQERLTDPEARIRQLARLARGRARQRELPFDADLSDLLPPPTHCPALGIPLSYAMGEGQRWDGPSIDRIDPAKGYVKGNRIVVSLLANTIKCHATPDQIQAVANFYKRLPKRRNQR